MAMDTDRTEGPEANVFETETPYGPVSVTFTRYTDDRNGPNYDYDTARVSFLEHTGRRLIVNGIAVEGYETARHYDPPFTADDGRVIEWSYAQGTHLRRLDGNAVTDNMRRKIYEMALETVKRVASENPHAVAAGRLATLRYKAERHRSEIAHLNRQLTEESNKLIQAETLANRAARDLAEAK